MQIYSKLNTSVKKYSKNIFNIEYSQRMGLSDQEIIAKRIRLILDSKNLLDKDVAGKIEISPQNFSNYLNGQRNITAKFLEKVSQGIGVPFETLRSGKDLSVYLRNDKTAYVDGGRELADSEFNGAEEFHRLDEEGVAFTANGMEFRKLSNGRFEITAPLVEQDAHAGYLAGYKDREYIEELPKHTFTTDKVHQGVYRSFTVRGDSMCDGSRDSICEGDIVDGRRVHRDLWKSKLHIHNYPDFVIVHHDGVVVKRIVDHDVTNGIIYCKSLNPDKSLFPDPYYRLSEVYELYNIISQEVKRKR